MKKEILLFFLVIVGSSSGYSLVAPLFPSIAIKRGITESMIGLIIGCFAFSNALIIPFCQQIFQKFRKRNIFLFCLIFEVLFFT